jgi:PAS domain S-box-containing protein
LLPLLKAARVLTIGDTLGRAARVGQRLENFMSTTENPAPHFAPRLPTGEKPSITRRLEHFEKRQNELWRITFTLLMFLAVVFAFVSWDTLKNYAHRFEVLPIGLVVLVVLFGVYVWKRTQEISELRGLVQGIEERDSAPPNDKQLEQLFEIMGRSQQGYRDLIDSFHDVLIALSLEGEIRAVNRTFANLVGASFQEIIGKPLSDFVQEASGQGTTLVQRALPKFMERRAWSGVLQVQLKNQPGTLYFECAAHAMVRGDKVHGITVLGTDVTDSRKTEARFTELFETLQEGIYIVDPGGAILDANPALVRMLGYESKSELQTRQVEDILPDRDERKSMQSEVERQPILQGREITLSCKDGSSIICLNTIAAVRDSSGKVIRYQGALMDVTGRRVMEKRLHQQQEFARRLIDSFPDLIFVLDNAANFTFVSPRVVDVLGVDPEEIRQQELGARTHPEDVASLRSKYEETLSGNRDFDSLEVRVADKNREWRLLRCNFSPLYDEKDQIDGVIISGRDVTDLKRLEEQLIQTEKLAAMGQMLAGVAHELNNPLTAILGVTELLRERAGMEEATLRQLELTHRQARRAAHIVQNLLEFSRPASPQKKALDVKVLVERTLQLQEHSLRKNNITVDFQSQRGLPEVTGDANQLIQVLLNLVTNAEQAIQEVRESGRIEIRLSLHVGRVSISVQDDGVGIRPEALPRIFDPFYTTKRPGGGTGLGLSICMSIIREHGGNLFGHGLPAGGSVFTVELPAAPGFTDGANRGGDDLKGEPGQADSQATRTSPSAVLVVDDEESIRAVLEEGLSAQGLHVDCAATPEEAIALVGVRSYDLLLCDLNLSSRDHAKISGRDAAARILSAAGVEKPWLVFMTGELINQDGDSRGEPRMLQKPFRISEVLELVREAASLKSLERVKG